MVVAPNKWCSTAILCLSGEDFMVCVLLLNIHAAWSSLAHLMCSICSWQHADSGQLIKKTSFFFSMRHCNWPYSCLKAVTHLFFAIAFVFMSQVLLLWFGVMCPIPSGTFMARVAFKTYLKLLWNGLTSWLASDRCPTHRIYLAVSNSQEKRRWWWLKLYSVLFWCHLLTSKHRKVV